MLKVDFVNVEIGNRNWLGKQGEKKRKLPVSQVALHPEHAYRNLTGDEGKKSIPCCKTFIVPVRCDPAFSVKHFSSAAPPVINQTKICSARCAVIPVDMWSRGNTIWICVDMPPQLSPFDLSVETSNLTETQAFKQRSNPSPHLDCGIIFAVTAAHIEAIDCFCKMWGLHCFQQRQRNKTSCGKPLPDKNSLCFTSSETYWWTHDGQFEGKQTVGLL